MILSSLVAGMLAGTAAPPAAEQPPPGGYWRVGERREPEPDDGQDNITIGSILFSLGVLRAGAGAVQVYLASPGQCANLESSGLGEGSCPSVRGYGWAGVALGGLFIGTGVTMLAIGLSQRKEHEAWKRRYGIAWGPAISPGHYGLSLGLRF
jgi:hypothetical protein